MKKLILLMLLFSHVASSSDEQGTGLTINATSTEYIILECSGADGSTFLINEYNIGGDGINQNPVLVAQCILGGQEGTGGVE